MVCGHTIPALRQLPAPDAAATAQIPRVLPAALLQTPPQHSAALEHVSPVCTQNDGFEQMPLLQNLEAQSLLATHGFPEVGFPPGFSGVHLPPPSPSGAHLPPQHSLSLAHARLSATHWTLEQEPPMHENASAC